MTDVFLEDIIREVDQDNVSYFDPCYTFTLEISVGC